jgi:DNA-directed RNA polymerase subunit RPC12/RpoP
MIDSGGFFVLYLAVILAPVAVLWILCLRRDRALRAPPAPRALFRCPECIRFYEGEEGVESMRCPFCGRTNSRLVR